MLAQAGEFEGEADAEATADGGGRRGAPTAVADGQPLRDLLDRCGAEAVLMFGGVVGRFGRPRDAGRARPALRRHPLRAPGRGGQAAGHRGAEYAEPDIVFTQNSSEAELKRLSLWRLLVKYPGMLVLAGLLVVVISVASQVGPKLTEYAINNGMSAGHLDFAVVVAMAVAYVVFVVLTSLAQRFQVQVTGRLAAWVMNDLRVKVFAHLQRLSLGFFTEEKAGVVMSRMTSDIENLQQLLQDGSPSWPSRR